MHWRLLSLWVTGILLTLGLCRGRSAEDEDYFEATTPDYDYNSTFEYYFFSNETGTVNYEVYEIIDGKDKESEQVDNKVRSSISNKTSGISLSAPIFLLALSIQRLFYPL